MRDPATACTNKTSDTTRHDNVMCDPACTNQMNNTQTDKAYSIKNNKKNQNTKKNTIVKQKYKRTGTHKNSKHFITKIFMFV